LCTRHHLHGRQVVAALEAGKHVYCEKPLCLTMGELEKILEYYQRRPDGPVLMVGFNRRFSPALVRARELVAGRKTPLVALYRVSAGQLPSDHWVHGPEGGGRIIGEACHMVDVFQYLVGGPLASVSGEAVVVGPGHVRPDENASFVLRFADGSVCTLVYSALGSSDYGKEYL